MAAVDWRGALLQRVAPQPNRWATPGAMAVELDPTTKQTPALDVIDRALVQLEAGELPEGDGNLLGLFMPPQEGKSQRVSRRYPAWALYNDPTLRIGIISYNDEKAERWGKAIRRDVESSPLLQDKIRIRRDSRAASKWETEQGGMVICAGIGAGITGEPLDRLIIDDPVRGRAEAESATYRETAWDTWESNLTTRQSDRFRACLMMTRWHEDDLAGRFEQRENGHWYYVTIPAVADSPDDPLGRPLGVEMESARGRKPGYFIDLKARRSPYVFASIYQQRPVPAEGGLFPRDRWQFWWPKTDDYNRQIVDTGQLWPLADCMRFITMDLARSMKTSADYTVVAAWAITPDGNLAMLDLWRGRVLEAEHWDKANMLRQRWDIPKVYVESRMFGTTFVYAAGRAGVPLEELEADTDKFTRAVAAAELQAGRRVHLPANADWLDEFLDEVSSFPNAAHDDQVDVLAYAARVVQAHWLREPAPDTWQPLAPASKDPIDRLFGPGLDLMDLNY